MRNTGQVVVLLLLVMVVALAIGLSLISRSVLEVSTSRKSEDSSRAFSAAEAGIEKAIRANVNNLGGVPIDVADFSLGNQASANISMPTKGLPLPFTALEYPPFGKESFAQFWLASPNNVTCEGQNDCYAQGSFDIYFGDPDTDKYLEIKDGKPEDQPAIVVNTIYWDVSDPNSKKYLTFSKYFDSYKDASGNRRKESNGDDSNDFDRCQIGDYSQEILTNNNTTNSSFYCKVTVSGYPATGGNFPVMVRVRTLYSNISHPVALKPAIGYSLPKQTNIYQATGTSGSVQRTLEVFHQRSVMPQIFDYVLFSAKDLKKS